MFLPIILMTSFLATCFCSPVEDWTTLRPKDCSEMEGALYDYHSPFGIVVNPYTSDSEGDYEEQVPTTTVTRIQTTVYTTTEFSTLPKPTKSSDIIQQIHDGQIQNGFETLPSTLTNSYTVEPESSCDDTELEPLPTTPPETDCGDDWDDLEGDEPSDDTVIRKRDTTIQQVLKQDQDGDARIHIFNKDKYNILNKRLEEGQDDAVPCEDEEDNEDNDNDVPCEDEENEDDYPSDSVYLEEGPVFAVACITNNTLAMTLDNSILRDSKNRIGSIVGNRQFQFDGPVPQNGAVFAAGWSISPDGRLALGGNTKFYQCSSGDFYKLYDSSISGQCNPVSLDAVDLVRC